MVYSLLSHHRGMNKIWPFVLGFGVCRDHLDTTDVVRTCKAWSVQQGLTGDDISTSADGELTQLLCGAGVRLKRIVQLLLILAAYLLVTAVLKSTLDLSKRTCCVLAVGEPLSSHISEPLLCYATCILGMNAVI